MATTTITNGTIEDIAQQAVGILATQLEPLNAFALEVTSDAKVENDVVKVGVYGASPDATAYNASTNNYITEDANTVTYKDVTLDTRLKATFSLEDMQSLRADSSKLMTSSMNGLSRAILKTVNAKILNANFSNNRVIGASTAFDSDDFADFWGDIEGLNWAEENRTAVMMTAYMTNLLKDNDLKNADASGDTGLLRKAKFSEVNGITPIQSKILTANGENLVGYLSNGTGLAFASAVIVPSRTSGNTMFTTATDAESGLTIGVREVYSDATGEAFYNFELLFGSAVADPTGIIRLTSA